MQIYLVLCKSVFPNLFFFFVKLTDDEPALSSPSTVFYCVIWICLLAVLNKGTLILRTLYSEEHLVYVMLFSFTEHREVGTIGPQKVYFFYCVL